MKKFKEKNTRKKGSASFIPAIEKEEGQLRERLERAKGESAAQIRQAKEQAEQKIMMSQQNLPELIAQKREQGLKKAKNEAEKLILSSEQHRNALLEQISKNMPKAVQSLVNAVTTLGDKS